MPTLFYKLRTETDAPLTYLLIEAIGEVSVELGEEASVGDVVRTAYAASYPDVSLSEPSLTSLVERVILYFSKLQKGTPAKGESGSVPTNGKKDGEWYASSFTKWLSALPPEQICLFIANYDIGYAEQLYCETDMTVVDELAAHRSAEKWESLKLGYEAVLFGMGGSYKGGADSEDAEDTVDLTGALSAGTIKDIESFF